LQASKLNGFDEGAATKAVDAFSEYVARYPKGEKVAQAKKNLDELRGRGTEGILNIARFYEGQKRIDAAILSYMEVAQKAPKSPEGQLAQAKVEELSKLRPAGAKPLLLSSQLPRGGGAGDVSLGGWNPRNMPPPGANEPALPQAGGAADSEDNYQPVIPVPNPFEVPPPAFDTNAPPASTPEVPSNAAELPASPDLTPVPAPAPAETSPSAKPLEQ
jgi:hypothetical protein